MANQPTPPSMPSLRVFSASEVEAVRGKRGRQPDLGQHVEFLNALEVGQIAGLDIPSGEKQATMRATLKRQITRAAENAGIGIEWVPSNAATLMLKRA